MTCSRCGGCLIPTTLIEEGARIPAAYCANCGNVIDAVIAANRTTPAAPPRRSRHRQIVEGIARRQHRELDREFQAITAD